jgi:hypothetical protein
MATAPPGPGTGFVGAGSGAGPASAGGAGVKAIAAILPTTSKALLSLSFTMGDPLGCSMVVVYRSKLNYTNAFGTAPSLIL